MLLLTFENVTLKHFFIYLKNVFGYVNVPFHHFEKRNEMLLLTFKTSLFLMTLTCFWLCECERNIPRHSIWKISCKHKNLLVFKNYFFIFKDNFFCYVNVPFYYFKNI